MRILAPYNEDFDLLRIARGATAPSSPVTGDIWVDTDASASSADPTSVWIPASQFFSTLNAPSLSLWNSVLQVWLLDGSTTERVSTIAGPVPSSWVTFAVDLLWANANAGSSGDVVWQLHQYQFLTTGDNASSGWADSSLTTTTAGAQNILVTTSQLGGADITNVPGERFAFGVIRQAGQAGDTLPLDAALIGVTLRQVT